MTDQNLTSTFQTSVFPLEDADGQARWTRLFNLSPQATPFSSIPYAKSLSLHFGIAAHIWLVSDGTTDLIGMLVFSQKKGPFMRVVVPAFTQYTTLLFSPDYHTPEPLMALLEKLSAAFDDLRLHFHPSVEDVRPLNWVSWQSTLYYTYHINLSTYDLSKSCWSSSARRNFNKHVAEYYCEENMELLGHCVKICADGYARNKRPFPVKPQLLYNLAADLSDRGMVRVFTASLASKPDTINNENFDSSIHAGIVVLHDDKCAYYWIAGSQPGPAMTVLIGHVLSELKASGLKLFDFVGANTPSIAEFKRRFGSSLTPYYAGLATPNRVMAAMLQTKRFFGR